MARFFIRRKGFFKNLVKVIAILYLISYVIVKVRDVKEHHAQVMKKKFAPLERHEMQIKTANSGSNPNLNPNQADRDTGLNVVEVKQAASYEESSTKKFAPFERHEMVEKKLESEQSLDVGETSNVQIEQDVVNEELRVEKERVLQDNDNFDEKKENEDQEVKMNISENNEDGKQNEDMNREDEVEGNNKHDLDQRALQEEEEDEKNPTDNALDKDNDIAPDNDNNNDIEASPKLKWKDHEDDIIEPKHDLNAPGEMGNPVIINKEALSPSERIRYDKGWKDNAYNQFASDMISVNRSLPDMRHPHCRSVHYQQVLPDTSVIMCFHDEGWSVLLRTVHSVINRTPAHLLKEIILVDDFSDMDHLQKPLEDYVNKLTAKVKIVRTRKREGLIRARIVGFHAATAQTVTFLDSHCEVTKGWIEPLLDRIATDERNVVCPVIDGIMDDTLKYKPNMFTNLATDHISIGGFNWDLVFTWHLIPQRELKRRKDDTMPVRSPTMAGGLFTISKAYFKKLGLYDPGMDIWGGENLELSFKTWMCGGTLEVAPCSRVGHIFRAKSPFSKDLKGKNIAKNMLRLAEVWLDDYKNIYFKRFRKLPDFGDVSERKELRKKLGCKSFSWYIKNVFPEQYLPYQSKIIGEIRSKKQDNLCLDGDSYPNNFNRPVIAYPCHGGPGQKWFWSKWKEIRRDDGCFTYDGGVQVKMQWCLERDRNMQFWVYRKDGTIFHPGFQKCMEVADSQSPVLMKPCTGELSQLWTWVNKK